MHEEVVEGDSGGRRYRTNKEVKKYLLAKRPREVDGLADIERITGYRTEACLAVNKAREDGAPVWLIDYLTKEYFWAIAQMFKQKRCPPAMSDWYPEDHLAEAGMHNASRHQSTDPAKIEWHTIAEEAHRYFAEVKRAIETARNPKPLQLSLFGDV